MRPSEALSSRWQLYRLLGEKARLRLLALAEEEELALGEIAELLGESLPNVSRHAAPLRQAGLLAVRRHGTRTFVRVAEEALADPVVKDALAAGRALCLSEGSLERIRDVVAARDARTREYFDAGGAEEETRGLMAELPAYLAALALLIPDRELAVDAGTGDGAFLELLAPIFRRVVAIDRSAAQLARAEHRIRERGYSNVSCWCAELDDLRVHEAVAPGADVVVAARLLHHAPRPRALVESLCALLRPGGKLLIIDYQRHGDEVFRERQADVWNGFEPGELEAHGRAGGLGEVLVQPLPSGLRGNASEADVAWQVLVGVKPRAHEARLSVVPG